MTIGLDAAYSAVGSIAVLTTGWGDAAVEATALELARICNDPDALQTAAEHIAHTWTRRDRPPLAVILEAYRAEVARRSANVRALPSAADSLAVVPASRGIEIASAAYRDHCRTEGRDPNLSVLHRFAAAIGNA
jgi:hypothetical protein